MTACPSLAVLESFATSRQRGQQPESPATAELREHIDSCAACREALEDLRANAAFLTRFRAAGPLDASLPTDETGAAAETPPPLVPDLVSGYQIEQEIYRGGQGVVYRAVQNQTRRTVAIKMLLAGALASGRQRERFEREVRIAASLRHPNIVTVYDSGAVPDGRYGLAMEFIDGQRLDAWSRSLGGAPGREGREARRDAMRRRLEVMIKICDGVLYAHQHAIVHRDLKPANILVDRDGVPHILDFGIARSMEAEELTRLTHTGEFAGTLAYASPEQVSGDPTRIDTRTDVYSLGVILYELVTGRMPYPVNTSIAGVIRSIESVTPLPPSSADDRPLDTDLSTIILKAMAKDPARRYQTVAGLRADLGRFLTGEAIEARRDSAMYVLRKAVSRHRLAFGGAAAVFVLLIGFGALMTWQTRQLAAALSVSNIERARVTAVSGDLGIAQDLIWHEFLAAGGSRGGFSGSAEAVRAYWALWDTFGRFPLEAELPLKVGDRGEVAFFRDEGRTLYAGMRSGEIVRWSVHDWKPLEPHRAPASGSGAEFRAAVSADLDRIAFLGNGIVKILDAESGNLLASADDPSIDPGTGAFSPDGRRLVTITRDGTLRMRDARTLSIVWENAAQSVCEYFPRLHCYPSFTPDGSRIAAARTDGSLGFWDAESGVLTRTLDLPPSCATYTSIGMRPGHIIFSEDGRVTAATLSTRLIVWDSQGSAKDLAFHTAGITAITFAPGRSDQIWTVGRDGAIVRWDLSAERSIEVIQGGRRLITTAAISPDGRILAAAAESVQVVETAPRPHVVTLFQTPGIGGPVVTGSSGRIAAIALAPGGIQGQLVAIVDLETHEVLRRLPHPGARVIGLAMAPDESVLFAAESTGRIVEWDLRSGTERRVYTLPAVQGPRPAALIGENQMRLSPDGRRLICADALGLVGLWDTSSGGWLGTIADRSGVPARAEFPPDGSRILVLSRGRAELLDFGSRKVLRKFPADPTTPSIARFSRDGERVYVVWQNSRTRAIDVRTGRETADGLMFGATGLALEFHPSQRLIAIADQDQGIRLWDVQTGRDVLSLRGHSAPIVSLAFTPDGQRLISSDLEGTVLMWDLAYYQAHIKREWERRTGGR